MPEEINDINKLSRHLCTLSNWTAARELPLEMYEADMCRKCVSPCRYGTRLLELLEAK